MARGITDVGLGCNYIQRGIHNAQDYIVDVENGSLPIRNTLGPRQLMMQLKVLNENFICKKGI